MKNRPVKHKADNAFRVRVKCNKSVFPELLNF